MSIDSRSCDESPARSAISSQLDIGKSSEFASERSLVLVIQAHLFQPVCHRGFGFDEADEAMLLCGVGVEHWPQIGESCRLNAWVATGGFEFSGDEDAPASGRNRKAAESEWQCCGAGRCGILLEGVMVFLAIIL